MLPFVLALPAIFILALGRLIGQWENALILAVWPGTSPCRLCWSCRFLKSTAS